MIEKARRASTFLSWYHQISLPEVKFPLTLHAWTRFFFLFLCSMFLLFFCFYFQQKKKARKMQIFIPLFSFSDILCIFTWCLSSWYINYIGFYITESSCLISAKFPCYIYLIDSYFPRAMKMCTIQGSPRIVKLTNSLGEPSPKNSGLLSKLQHKKETSSYSSKLIVTWINFTASVLIQPYILSFMVQVKIKIVLLLRGRVSDEGD
jgi:hypothetical protein